MPICAGAGNDVFVNCPLSVVSCAQAEAERHADRLRTTDNWRPTTDNRMKIRDRIKELRRVPAAELRPNPRNWRTHSAAQRDALQGILAEVGYAGALLARELPDGSLELIDGHLRAVTTPDMPVPVLVLDVSEDEANKILATHDPLTAMAGVDRDALRSLLDDVQVQSESLQTMLADLLPKASALTDDESTAAEAEIPRIFQVIVECSDEAEQQAVYEQLVAEDHKCRLLTL